AEAIPAPAVEAPTPAPIENPIAPPDGLTDTQASVFEATANSIYRWRTVRSVARQVRLPQGTVRGDLETLVELGHVQKRDPSTNGVIVYGAKSRITLETS
ncbi:MAG: hypothetical protein IID39_09310, partial [Planctomycetes bacterium]|nr:hypothetical protein [Planctomycetota bacterium]